MKIDRSLITDINTNVKKQHFLTGIIDFARLNNIKVLAEGVETYDEMSVTIRRGADYIQGFYTARPQKEIVPDISDTIAEQMRMLNMHRPNIKVARYYTVKDGKNEKLDIEKMLSERYTGVIVESASVHLTANGCDNATFVIKTENGSKCRITLDNVNIKSGMRQCIQIGENSDATIEIKGQNTLNYDGILVPDTAKLTITGDGSLYIDSYRNDGCCIGSSYNDTFGEITIDMTGSIEMQANGDHGICIGGVSSSEMPIKLLGGSINMSSTGKDCIGVGSYDGSCGIETGNAIIDINCSGDNAVALGSLCGYVDIRINGTKLILRALGIRAGCVGALSALDGDNPSSIDIRNASFDLLMKAMRGAAVGCRKTECNININSSDFKIHIEGEQVAGIGSSEGKGALCAAGSDIQITSISGTYSVDVGFTNGKTALNNTTINSAMINDPDYHEPVRMIQ